MWREIKIVEGEDMHAAYYGGQLIVHCSCSTLSFRGKNAGRAASDGGELYIRCGGDEE
jgi:hypothetical protein